MRTVTITENDKEKAETKSDYVRTASNVLFKSVDRFKVRTSPSRARASPRPHEGLTWQVTLPDAKQLRLSEDAVLHMRRILDEFTFACDGGISRGSTRQRLHQLLAAFFDTFGSHVFRGPVTYGGLLHVRGEMVSEESMSASTARNAAAMATSKSASRSTSVGFSGEASYIARCTRMIWACVCMHNIYARY